jgi:hypothetical protein
MAKQSEEGRVYVVRMWWQMVDTERESEAQRERESER